MKKIIILLLLGLMNLSFNIPLLADETKYEKEREYREALEKARELREREYLQKEYDKTVLKKDYYLSKKHRKNRILSDLLVGGISYFIAIENPYGGTWHGFGTFFVSAAIIATIRDLTKNLEKSYQRKLNRLQKHMNYDLYKDGLPTFNGGIRMGIAGIPDFIGDAVYGYHLRYNILEYFETGFTIDYCSMYRENVWWDYTSDHIEKDATITDIQITYSINFLFLNMTRMTPYIGLNYGLHRLKLEYNTDITGNMERITYFEGDKYESTPAYVIGIKETHKNFAMAFEYRIARFDDLSDLKFNKSMNQTFSYFFYQIEYIF